MSGDNSMGQVEIDRLRIPSASDGEDIRIDLRVDDGTICCLFSRDIDNLRKVGDSVTGLGDGYEGRIFINGNPIDKYPCGKRGIAICGRNIGLYDHLTVAGNIAIPFKTLGIKGPEMKPRIENRLLEFGLYDSASVYPEDLCPADRLLLSFAKAASSNPELLVCDLICPSPSGIEGYGILSLLKNRASAMGLTVLALTDSSFHALNFADQIAYLGDGKILQQDPPKDIINSPEHIEVAKDFAFPMLNIFDGIVTEETPFLFVEDDGKYFNLPERLKNHFIAKLGMRQYMAVRPEYVQLVQPNDSRTAGKNTVTISRIDYLGLGVFAFFKFGSREWCAFLPPEKRVYPGMRLGVFVPEDQWLFIEDNGDVLLDL
jgi:ABC-type sugar transport system ATPase subunit